MVALEKQDPDAIEEILNAIDKDIDPASIPKDDKDFHERAREILKKLRDPKCIHFKFKYQTQLRI